MDRTFAFAGDQVVGNIVAGRLQRAGYALAPGVDSADFILTYCLAQSQLEDIYLGTGGLVESAAEGCCLIDLSPSTVTLAKELYAMARVNELQALDAPLVLKDPCAHDAFGDPDNVMLLVGGEDEALAQARPLLEALSHDVRYLGKPGSGQMAKAMCTVQQAAAAVALIEASAIAKTQGEDGSAAIDAAVEAGLVAEGARALHRAVLDRHFHGNYTCEVLMAELTAVMEGAEEIDLVLPQAESCQRLLELFLVIGGSDLPVSALSLIWSSDADAAEHGLDWSRAEGIYDHDHDHGHDHGHGADGDDAGYGDYDDYDGFGDDDDDSFAAGFAGFSSN